MGMLLIVLCTTCLGLSEANKLKQKAKEAERILIMIEQIKIRLQFSAASTSEILQEMKQVDEVNALPFVANVADRYDTEPFDSLWEKEVRYADFSISSDDVAMLVSFGQSLGTTDLDGQLELCSIFKKRFADRQSFYENEYKKKAKLYVSLGFFLGLGAAVILI